MASSSSDTKPAPKKRGPGRPPKIPPPPAVERKGIVKKPEFPDSLMEFAYDRPQDFKGIFCYFKNMKARDIHVKCRKDSLIFFVRDHSKMARSIIRVSGDQTNWFYCDSSEPSFGMNRENIEGVFSAIDKTFYKITLQLCKGDEDHLTIVMKNNIIDKDCEYQIVLSNFDEDQELYLTESLINDSVVDSFRVMFTLMSKDFKKMIGDVSNFSSTMTVEKYGKNPLQISYVKPGVVRYHEVYHDDGKIDLKDDIEEGESFTCSMNTSIVKSIAGSMITDRTRIMCKDTDVMFMSVVDNSSMTIYTFIRTSET